MDCDVCQEEEVAFIVGNAATGEQQYMGPACMARFGLEFAKAVLPAEEIAAVIGPMFIQGGGGESDKPAAGPKRKRDHGPARTVSITAKGEAALDAHKAAQKPAEPAAAEGQTGGPAEVQTATQDG